MTLALLLILAADGGMFSDPLYSTCPEAPPVVELDGGWLLTPPERGQRVACLMATCETDRQTKKEALNQKPPVIPVWLQVALNVAVAVPGIVGVVDSLTKK